jgi:hypothetical protein
MAVTLLSVCCGNRSSVAWPDTRMSTTPSGSATIPRCDRRRESGLWMLAVRQRGVVLDMDSSVSPTHGDQENSVWNSHYACTCSTHSSCSTSSATSSAAGYFYVLPFWRLASLCGYGRGMQLQNSSENATVYASWDLSEESSGESRLKARPPGLAAELHVRAENLARALLAR